MKVLKTLLITGLLCAASSVYGDAIPVITRVEGSVMVSLNGASHTPESGERVEWGSVITTGENATVTLETPDGSEITLYSHSRLMVDASLIESRPRVILSYGTVFQKVAKFFSRMVSFRVFSPSAVCGVRGTEFYVEAGLDGSSMVYVKEGKVEVGGELLKAGEALEVIWKDNGWFKRRKRMEKYAPGAWARKHHTLPRDIVRRLIESDRVNLKEVEKRLRESLKDGKVAEGRAGDLVKAEIDAGRWMSRLMLLSSKPWKERLGPRAKAFVKKELKRTQKIAKRMRRLPVRVRHAVEREMRLVNIPHKILERYLSMKPEERRQLIQRLKKWKSLTPEQRARVVRNYIRFKKMPPKLRKRIIENYKRFIKLPPEERRRILQLYRKWKQLPPEERERLRQRFREMKQKKKHMPPRKKGRPPKPRHR